MAAKEVKTWDDYSGQHKSRLTRELSEAILARAASEEEAANFVAAIIARMASTTKLPLQVAVLQILSQQTKSDLVLDSCWQKLLDGLGSIRRNALTNPSQHHMPRISVADIDEVVVKAGFPDKVLKEHGYRVGKTLLDRLRSQGEGEPSSSSRGRVGRKSKVDDDKHIATVKAILDKYSNDSSKVVKARVLGQKQLVVARLLSKRLWRIWKEEKELREALAFGTFRKVGSAKFSIP